MFMHVLFFLSLDSFPFLALLIGTTWGKLWIVEKTN